jgi:uncharacterized protein (TIGR03437 family)
MCNPFFFRLRGLLLGLAVAAVSSFGGTVVQLPALPSGAVARALQVDATGNIYVAGSLAPASPKFASDTSDSFVAKLSPDGSSVLYFRVLGGDGADSAAALALGPDDSVYVTGTTASADFPTTQGSLQASSLYGGAFAFKLDPTGAVVYSTFLGGAANTTGNAIAVDSSGHAFITGTYSEGTFPTTPGAITGVPIIPGAYGTGYVIELDAAGSTAPVAVSGFGGVLIAIDQQDDIFAVGAFGPSLVGSIPAALAPTTPGAFQTSAAQAECSTDPFFLEACAYQHIAKINPTGTQLIYATYLAGAWGATPAGIAVDSDGTVILAGSTNSPDYPTTPGSYQPEYFANPEPAQAGPFGGFFAPPSAGYVTKLNASGTGLVWSTFFGGSAGGDSISGLAVDSSGNILVAGPPASADLPGLELTPVASRPTFGFNLGGFVARLSPDGSMLSPTQLLPGSFGSCQIAVRADGTAIVDTSTITNLTAPEPTVTVTLFSVSLSPLGRVTEITDAADNAKIVSVAPGLLLALHGTSLAPGTPNYPSNGFPSSLNGVTVTFNGMAAPILYTSPTQLNLQVPYEIEGQTQVTMQVTSQFVSPPVSESYILAVAARQPSVFLSSSIYSQPIFNIATCSGQSVATLQPLAFNADGTVNSCANPAAPGSAVTIFLNGLGVTNPAQTTGAASSSLTALTPGAAVLASIYPSATTTILSTDTLPGSIASVAQVQIQVPSSSTFLNLLLELERPSGARVRGTGIVIWTMPAN